MYFNPMANQPPALPPTEGSFLLTVWTSLDPEVIQHQNFSFSSPEYRLDGIDKFVEYPLDSAIRVEGTIYVGWSQTNAAAMNLGFDRNRNNKTKIFYKIGSSWANTSFNGSLMMRPVMVAAVDPWAAVEEQGTTARPLTIYPNPADGSVRLSLQDGPPRDARIECLDATGRPVLDERFMDGAEVRTASLAEGLYVLRVIDDEGATIAQGRFIVQHR
jgi:hypothetical protein